MASLARVLAWHGLDLPRAQALAGDAVAAARQLGDLHSVAACLLAQHNAIWQPGTARERRGLAAEVIELVQGGGDPELLLEARLLAATDLMELADPAFRTELEEFLRLAGAAGQPRFQYAALVRRATLALLAGRLAEAQRLIDQAVMLGEECGEPGARDVWNDQTWDLLAAQGRLGELAGVLPDMFPDPESRPARGFQAMALLAAGATEQAAEMIGPVLEELTAPPANHQWLLSMAHGAELAAAFSARPLAERLYQELGACADQAVVSGAAITFRGAVAHHLGVLAAMLGRTDEAVTHLESAIAVHERLGALPWALRSRYELAGSWLHEPARRDAAVAALAEVAGEANRLGMTQLARNAEARGFAAGGTPVASGVLRRDGTKWTLSYGGVTVRLRHAKGLGDLAVLLALPGRPVPAADLIAAAGAGEAGLADLRLGSDEVFDATARRQIQARLADLDEEIAEAEGWADLHRATRAREERDAVLRELAAAAGLAGRGRQLGDQSERARKTVTARIRDVIGRIEQVHPALGAHLAASITTGTYCAYSPPAPVSWQV
jgi:tetratricopeptide (TPR) repeat protein